MKLTSELIWGEWNHIVWQTVCVPRYLIFFSIAFHSNIFKTKTGFNIGWNIELGTFFEGLYFQLYFRNGRRVHRFILCQNYIMMFPLVLYPPPYFEAEYCLFCGRRRVAVARYRMICLVLTKLNLYSHFASLQAWVSSPAEYTCQIWSLYLLWFKVMAKVKVFLPQRHKQTGQKLDATEYHSGSIKIF